MAPPQKNHELISKKAKCNMCNKRFTMQRLAYDDNGGYKCGECVATLKRLKEYQEYQRLKSDLQN